MRSHRVLVIQPGIGRSKEILILNVDKGLCVSDEVHVLSHYGVVDQPAPLFVHVDLVRSILRGEAKLFNRLYFDLIHNGGVDGD